MHRWRLLPYKTYTAAENMALDEAILIAHSKELNLPTLRFYGWNPAAVSIGYFQNATEIDFHQVAKLGLDYVRRPTGGRAILHERELTYSIVLSTNYPDLPANVSESYRYISQGLLTGFRKLGIEAKLAPPVMPLNKKGLPNCFDTPSDYELVVSEKKIAGSAQTRYHQTILQHGSILIDVDKEKLFQVLRFASSARREQASLEFSKKVDTISNLCGNKILLSQVIDAFTLGFAQGLGIGLEEGTFTDYENSLADDLIITKYNNKEWNLNKGGRNVANH